MKYCPACHKPYENDELLFCPQDGSRLKGKVDWQKWSVIVALIALAITIALGVYQLPTNQSHPPPKPPTNVRDNRPGPGRMPITLKINKPVKDAPVALNETIEGEASSSEGFVYVVVIDKKTGTSHIQEGMVKPDANGRWAKGATFGTADVGKDGAFVVYAFISGTTVQTGRSMPEDENLLPQDAGISNRVEVVRK